MRLRLTILTAAATAAALVAAPAGAEDAAPRAAPSSTPSTVTIGTHNVFRGAARYRPFAAVIGWQEVYDAPDRARLKRLKGYTTFFPPGVAASADPISWRTDRFRKLDGGATRAFDGQAGVAPNLYVAWALLRDRRSGRRLILINNHFINAAFSSRPERLPYWKHHANVLRDTIKRLREEHGAPIFVVGDINRHEPLELPGLRYVRVKGATEPPIDQIHMPTTSPDRLARRLSRAGSDHFAYRVTTTF